MNRAALKKTLLASYYVALAAMILAPVFALYLGQGVDMLVGMLGPLVLAVVALGVLGWALVRSDWSKFYHALLALLIGVALVLGGGHRLRLAGAHLYFALEHEKMDSLSHEILAYRRISSMSDGTRYFIHLNGELVGYSPAELDTAKVAEWRRRVPLDSVLKRDAIDRRRYEELRSRLRLLRFTSFSVYDDYVVFVSDGFLDNLYGFIYVRPGRQPPHIGTRFEDSTELVSLMPLRDSWYYFGTT